MTLAFNTMLPIINMTSAPSRCVIVRVTTFELAGKRQVTVAIVGQLANTDDDDFDRTDNARPSFSGVLAYALWQSAANASEPNLDTLRASSSKTQRPDTPQQTIKLAVQFDNAGVALDLFVLLQLDMIGGYSRAVVSLIVGPDARGVARSTALAENKIIASTVGVASLVLLVGIVLAAVLWRRLRKRRSRAVDAEDKSLHIHSLFRHAGTAPEGGGGAESLFAEPGSAVTCRPALVAQPVPLPDLPSLTRTPPPLLRASMPLRAPLSLPAPPVRARLEYIPLRHVGRDRQ